MLAHQGMGFVARGIDRPAQEYHISGHELLHILGGERRLEMILGHRITSVALRLAQHWKFMATGKEAVWQKAFSILMPRAVVSPPRPMGPMPREFIVSNSCSSCGECPGHIEQSAFGQARCQVKAAAEANSQEEGRTGIGGALGHGL